MPVHGDRGQRHKQQRQRHALDELRPEDVPVSGVQIQAREPVQRPSRDQQPSASTLRGSKRESSVPTIGIAMNDPSPRGAMAMPAWSAGYPSSVCSKIGSSTRLPYKHEANHRHQKDTRANVRSLNTRRCTTGSAVVGSRITNAMNPSYRQHRQGDDEARSEPVLLLPFVEHHLQGADAHRQHADAPVVDAAAALRLMYGGSKMNSRVMTIEASPPED